MAHGKVSGSDRGVGAGERKLDTLVLADRPAEDPALAGIARRLVDEPSTVADAFGRDQDPFGIHAVEDVSKAAAALPHEGIRRNHEILEEDLGRRMIHHRANRPDRETRTHGLAHVDQEHGQALRALGRLGLRRGSCKQQHEIRVFGTRGPDLLAIDDEVIVLTHGRRAQRQRVAAARGLRHAERLEADLAGGDLGQPAAFLLFRPVAQECTHHVDLRVAGRAVTAARVDLLEHRSGRAKPKPAATVVLGDQDAQESGLGQCPHERRRIRTGPIEIPPVRSRKVLAERTHRVANLGGRSRAHDRRQGIMAQTAALGVQ